MEEIAVDKKEWVAPEYTHKPRNNDWFWTIGLLTIAGASVAFWFANYLFTVFILMSGAALFMFSLRQPREINFEINNEGVKMGGTTYGYKTLQGFAVKDGSPYATLLISTSKQFLPILNIPIPAESANEVKESLQKAIPLIELQESRAMAFMEKIGF